MRKCLLIFLFVLFSTLPLYAQSAPDYAVLSLRQAERENPTEAVIQFEVQNTGSAFDQSTVALITNLRSRQQVASTSIPPLQANETQTVTLRIPYTVFSPEEVVSLGISVGLTEEEAAQTIGGRIGITIPAAQVQPTLEMVPTEEVPPAETTDPTEATTPFDLPLGIDLTNPLHIALLIGAGGILLILIWMFTVILRLLFSRPPTFTTWQPPYVSSPLMNPNSTAGRRQLWQQHAQGDALPLTCAPGNFMARKMLIGMNGGKLAGWRVTAMRISQYDMYGRVARSQTIAVDSVVKRIDSAVRRSAKLNPKRIQGAVRPAVKRLLRDFRKRSKRTPSLPVALDIRLKGTHGEVRIIFELHQCVDNQWQMVDQWEPEMTILSGSIFENFTYSLYGQRPGESMRQFQQRLQDDLVEILIAMIQQPPPPPPISAPPESESDTARMQAVVEDTTSNT